ncbi:MAG: 30S ribosomal protein S12 methylthiotransferase RimO [Candidatus Omnitrophica bacterium]|nr:30S ribosomal protein S12 methylthiotransferase RimO [Candidatus Omnitrophota bacterium]
MSAYSQTKHFKSDSLDAPVTTIAFTSLGCAKNLVDSEVMLGLLNSDGYRLVTDEQPCDVAIVNTCGFIDSSRKESVDEILHLAELKNKGRIRHLVVAGCLAQKFSKDLLKEIPEIDAAVGTGEFQKIHLIVRQLQNRRLQEAVAYPEFLYDETTPRIGLTAPHSRYIKIAEGCNHTCSFCIIPQMRGAYRSRPVSSIVAEVRQLVKQGLKEACLISQETTYYGRDMDRQYHLPKLLEQLNQINELRWIRLFYNHPQHMAPPIIESIAKNKKVVPYIDLPLQHIHDRILKSMNRGVTKHKTKQLLDQIRNTIPGAVLRTSFIVGYPGETHEEFEELCSFVKETRFDHVGVFTYSRETDVPSGHLPDQIASTVKKTRYRRLMKIQQSISLERNRQLVGSDAEVLIEGRAEKPHWYIGRSYRQAPEIDGNVYVESRNKCLTPGSFVTVRINDALPYDLFGKTIES